MAAGNPIPGTSNDSFEFQKGKFKGIGSDCFLVPSIALSKWDLVLYFRSDVPIALSMPQGIEKQI